MINFNIEAIYFPKVVSDSHALSYYVKHLPRNRSELSDELQLYTGIKLGRDVKFNVYTRCGPIYKIVMKVKLKEGWSESITVEEKNTGVPLINKYNLYLKIRKIYGKRKKQ
jgi:hypothetical protein